MIHTQSMNVLEWLALLSTGGWFRNGSSRGGSAAGGSGAGGLSRRASAESDSGGYKPFGSTPALTHLQAIRIFVEVNLEDIQLDLVKGIGSDEDLYSEVIYVEFLLCTGHLFAFSEGVAQSVRRQEAEAERHGGSIPKEHLAEMLDAFLVDDFLPRYRQQDAPHSSGGRGKKVVSGHSGGRREQSEAATASAAAQRHRMAQRAMHGDGNDRAARAPHDDPTRAAAGTVEYGPQPLVTDEILDFEISQHRTADVLAALRHEGTRHAKGKLVSGLAASALTTPILAGQKVSTDSLGQEGWLEAATRGGPQRRELDWLMEGRAYGYDLSEVAVAIKEESEKAESAAGMNEIFRRYSMYS